MEDINRHIEIDNYLNGNLSVEERAAFENKMNNDLGLKDEVEAFKLANDVIKLGAQVDIKSKLQNIHNNHLKVQKRKKWGYGGAILLFLIILIGVIVNPFSSNKKLADKKDVKTPKTILPVTNKTEDKSTKSPENKPTVTQNTSASIDTVRQLLQQNNDTVILTTEETPIILQENNKQQVTENKQNKKGDEHNENPIKSDKTKENPCSKTEEITPQYNITLPCLGHKQGSFELLSSTDNTVHFSEYSLDGGKTFVSNNETSQINRGIYNVIVKDVQGCLTKAKKVNVKYQNCNFVIQPSYGKFLELSLAEYIDYPIRIEIRNARSAQVVYQKNIGSGDNFIWEGKDQSNSDLPLGNYVYFFISETEGLIAQGQITVVN